MICFIATDMTCAKTPLVERKELLRQLFGPHPQFVFQTIRLMQGKELFDLACKEGLEGIIGNGPTANT